MDSSLDMSKWVLKLCIELAELDGVSLTTEMVEYIFL